MKNLSFIGLMGCGKSTIGKLLAESLDCDFVDIDTQIEQKTCTSITEIFASKGEEFFREVESEVIEEFATKERQIISTGGGAVQDQTNLELLKNNSTVIYLKTSPEVLFERIKDDSTRPLLQNQNPLETLKELLKKRSANYEKADIIVTTDGKTTEEIAKEILKNVKS